METLRSHFRSGIFISLAVFGRPNTIFRIGVVGPDGDFSTFRHWRFVPLHSNRSHHGLTGISKPSWGSMIESVPLVVDHLNTTMRIMPGITSLEAGAILAKHHST